MSDFFIAVGADPMDAGSIDIHDETTYAIMAGTLDLSVPSQIGFVLRVRGATADARIASANALFRLIRSAALADSIGSSVTFSMRPEGTDYVHYDLTGDMADPERNFRLSDSGKTAFYTMLLNCYEYSRGDAVTVTGDISGTKAGSTAAFLVSDVPGHIDALAHLELTDTSGSGVINCVRVATIRGDFSAATDYTPWVDAVAHGGAATDEIDATALGGEVAERVLSSTSFVDIARAVQPAGTRQRGRMDGYARVSSTATAIGTPGSLAGTVQRSPAVIQQTKTGSSSFGSSTSQASGTLTLTKTGSTLVAFVKADWVSGITVSISGWTEVAQGYSYDNTGAGEAVWGVSVLENATPTTSSVTATFSTATSNRIIRVFEVANAETPYSLDAFVADTGTGTIRTSVAVNNVPAMYIGGSMTGGWISYTNFSMGGPTTTSNGMSTATRLIERALSFTATGTASTTTEGVAIAVIGIMQQTPTAGQQLDAGTYTARVQAIDAAGYRGNASSSVTATPTIDQNSITWSWTAVTNATAYSLTIQHGSRFYEVIMTGTSYELETLDGLNEVAALPATSGAVAPPPSIRALVATKNDHAMTPVPEVATDGSGSMTILRAFTNRMLPPVASPIADTWPDYAIEVQGRSANGQNATVQVDAIWIVPCREPQVEAWIQGVAHATKVRHILESHRSGRGTNGWLETIATGVEAGRLTTSGTFLLPTGTSIVLLEFEQAADVHTFAAQVTATMTYWPRQRWEAE